MAWPTPQDYNETVQNPILAFDDSELRTGFPELTPLGLPRPITGAFASVYKMQCSQRTWAVRCFLRHFNDQERRYTAISNRLAQVQLPYTVGFTFLGEGIKVRGQWYPILKMEWIHGESLNGYIEKNLGNPKILCSLASRWVEMMKALQKASIAHGDLQHGNILVVNGELRLIDYDGMHVPDLIGMKSHEMGHRNYQHPKRTESDFGPFLDNFSAWVIYISLIALAIAPNLWNRFGCGDESLLFRQIDFERPETSDVLHALESHKDERIQSVTTLFKSLLYLKPQDVPFLDGSIATPPGKVIQSGSDWLRDYIPPGNNKVNVAEIPQENLGTPLISDPDPSWILDMLSPSTERGVRASFKNSVLPDRIILSVSVIIIFSLVWMTQIVFIGMLSLSVGISILLILNICLLIWRYRSDPKVYEIIPLNKNLTVLNKEIQNVENSIKEANKEKILCRKHHDEERVQIEKKQKEAEEAEKKTLESIQRDLQCSLSSINNRRHWLQQEETDALGKIQNDIGLKVTNLNRQIRELTQAENTEYANALLRLQEQHITAYLRRFPLQTADIQGVGPTFKKRLWNAGVHTAADVDFGGVQRVQGIGTTRASSLCDWRKAHTSQAHKTMPQALTQSDTATIRAKYEKKRQALEIEKNREQQRQENEKNTVRARCKRSLEQMINEECTTKSNKKNEIDEIRAKYARQYRLFRKNLEDLEKSISFNLSNIDEKIAEKRKDIFSLRWKMENLRRHLKSFDGIRFSKYVKRVFLGSLSNLPI